MSVSPSQDTEGSEINLAAAPEIEHEPPLEQTQAVWEQAEVTVVSRVISGAPPDLQELTPIHLSNCLSAGKGTHTETPTGSANRQSVGVGCVPFGVAKVFSHLGRRMWVRGLT